MCVVGIFVLRTFKKIENHPYTQVPKDWGGQGWPLRKGLHVWHNNYTEIINKKLHSTRRTCEAWHPLSETQLKSILQFYVLGLSSFHNKVIH